MNAPRYALDLTKRHFVHQRGDLTVYGTWYLGGEDGPRPCLAIIPTHRQSFEKATPCVVTIDEAWVWSEEIGDGQRSAQLAFDFAAGLDLDTSNVNSVMRVASIIREHLGDLATIPPWAGEVQAVADAVVTDREGRSREAEIFDRV